ncbi:hypothetical protein HanIR_Chr17g0850671 [Helianthus annuus]|nr:hypothetical protein HanIR_Chr17g0850671 [Helianthus annuus]
MPPNPSPTIPHGRGFEWWGAPIPRVNQCPNPSLNPSPTIPHGLSWGCFYNSELESQFNISFCCNEE